MRIWGWRDLGFSYLSLKFSYNISEIIITALLWFLLVHFVKTRGVMMMMIIMWKYSGFYCVMSSNCTVALDEDVKVFNTSHYGLILWIRTAWYNCTIVQYMANLEISKNWNKKVGFRKRNTKNFGLNYRYVIDIWAGKSESAVQFTATFNR